PPPEIESDCRVGLLLLRDHLVLDFVVGRLRDDALLHELILTLVGPSLDDLVRVGAADARKAVEVSLGSGIDVEHPLCMRSLGRQRPADRYGERRGCCEDKRRGNCPSELSYQFHERLPSMEFLLAATSGPCICQDDRSCL